MQDVRVWAVNLEAKVAARKGSVFGDALQRNDWRRGGKNLHPARRAELWGWWQPPHTHYSHQNPAGMKGVMGAPMGTAVGQRHNPSVGRQSAAQAAEPAELQND